MNGPCLYFSSFKNPTFSFIKFSMYSCWFLKMIRSTYVRLHAHAMLTSKEKPTMNNNVCIIIFSCSMFIVLTMAVERMRILCIIVLHYMYSNCCNNTQLSTTIQSQQFLCFVALYCKQLYIVYAHMQVFFSVIEFRKTQIKIYM